MPSPSESSRGNGRFRRELTSPVLALLVVGGVMGSGLFLGSGLAIQHAGPAVIALFAIGWLAMYLEMRALGEMAVANPTPGSFLVYMRDVLGPGWTFVAGWVYWLSSVLTMSSEVTAAALITQFWFPGTALWVWALAYSAGIVAMNFLSVRGFGAIEGTMAAVKAAAVFVFIAVAGLFVLGIWGAPHGMGISAIGAVGKGGWLPHGWLGAAPALLLVLFAYAGTGIVGMAAAETRAPSTTIPQAVVSSGLIIGAAYLLSMGLVLTLVPWTRISAQVSPFVLAMRALGIPGAASMMNLVLLLAVLSTMNAALFSNVRVLYSLADGGEAPGFLKRLNAQGQPTIAIWASAALLVVTIFLAYVLPRQAYAYLITATGFQAMFIWLMILLTHLKYRPYLIHHRPQSLTFRLRGYPFTTLFAMAVVIAAMAASPLARGELVGFLIGVSGIVLAIVGWFAVKPRRQPTAVGDPPSP